MKKIIRLLSFIVLTVCCCTATAQIETQVKEKKIKDSIFKLNHPGRYVPDSVPYVRKQNIQRKIFRDSLVRKNDSLIYVKRKFADSSLGKFTLAKTKIQFQKDSLHRKMFVANLQMDSLKRQMVLHSKMDTLYRKKMLSARKFDSLQRLQKISLFKYDSLGRMNPKYDSARRLYAVKRIQSDSLKKFRSMNFKVDSLHKNRLFVRPKFDTARRLNKMQLMQSDSLRKLYALSADSFHRFKKFQNLRMDSLKREIYLQNIKTDSQRIKKYLQLKKVQLQQYRDTAALREGYRSRALTTEITCNYGDTLFIVNTYKKIVIKTVPHQRLKLSAKIDYKDEINDKDDVVFKMMGISLSRSNKAVTASVTGLKPQGNKNNTNNKVDGSLNSLGKLAPFYANVNSEGNINRALFMEVPENVVIYLDSKYADCSIENYVKNITVNITNGSLQMASADNAAIKSKYSTINADEIKTANLNFSTTKFTASNIASMTVVSNASNMQIDNCNSMALNSKSDEYKIENAGSISGNKDFGKLNIENLKDQLVLKGANSDVKITSFNYASPFIKIDSKYADVKLPLYNQKNYAVYYEGSYNDVNKLSSATQKINGTGTVTAKASLQQDTAVVSKALNVNKTKFEATAGDITGKHTKVDIVCPFCNVVFN